MKIHVVFPLIFEWKFIRFLFVDDQAGSLKDNRDDIEFIKHRIKVFGDIFERQCAERQAMKDEPIRITLPDGTVKEGFRYKTTPLMIAEGIHKMLANQSIVSKVNGKLWDLFRPLEGACNLELLKWDSDEAKEVFWHSSSHVLGQAMERYVCWIYE